MVDGSLLSDGKFKAARDNSPGFGMWLVVLQHPDRGVLAHSVYHLPAARCTTHYAFGLMGSRWMMAHCAMDRVRKIASSLQPSARGGSAVAMLLCMPLMIT